MCVREGERREDERADGREGEEDQREAGNRGAEERNTKAVWRRQRRIIKRDEARGDGRERGGWDKSGNKNTED